MLGLWRFVLFVADILTSLTMSVNFNPPYNVHLPDQISGIGDYNSSIALLVQKENSRDFLAILLNVSY